MIPKVSAALSRLLKPLKEISSVGKLNKFSKTSKDPEGGGSLPYEKLTKEDPKKETKKDPEKQTAAQKTPEPSPPRTEKQMDVLPHSVPTTEAPDGQKPTTPFVSGLTEVILELKSDTHKNIKIASSGSQYEQNGGPRANKGAMLDKKVG